MKLEASLIRALLNNGEATPRFRGDYEGGTVSYLELLDAERQAAQVKAQRLIATVRLIKALGGAW